MKTIFSALTLFAICSATILSAAEEAKDTPALRLIEVINFVESAKQAGTAMMVPMIEQLKTQGLPDAAIAEFKDAANRFFTKTFEDPAIKGEVAAVYENHYTNEELEELLVFYQTPLGAKTLVTMPDVMQESMVVGQKFAAKNQEEFQKEIQMIMEKYLDVPPADPEVEGPAE